MTIRQQVIKKFREWASIDIRALGVMRISFGAIILLDLCNRAQFFIAHYTSGGVVPNSLALSQTYIWPFSLHLLNDSPDFQAALFIIAGIFAFMMMVGYRTRLATFASWLLLISLQAGNPFVLYGGDTELRVMMFFALFIPWGNAYSFDVRKHHLHKRFPHIATFATFALLLQVTFIYLFGSLNKTGIEWQDGSAVFYALSSAGYQTSLGKVLLHFPALLTFLTFAIFWLQRCCIFFLFSPVYTRTARTIVAVLLLIMQLGFLTTLSLNFFPLISITALVAFLPERFWDFVDRVRGKKRKHGIATI